MKFRKLFTCLVVLFFPVNRAFAQIDSLFQAKDTTLVIHQYQIKFYDFSVPPQHFQLTDSLEHPIDSLCYQTDFVRAILIIKDSSLLGKKIRIRHLTYPYSWRFPLGKPVEVTSGEQKEFSGKIQTDETDFFDGIETSGYFTRGVMNGNNMNTSAVSKMDLTLHGNLSDKIRIDARLFDDNLPSGYEGITTSFNDINRFHVRISGPEWTIFAGDSLMEINKSILLYTTHNQGLGGRAQFSKAGVQVYAGINWGKIAENIFTLTKGNYGPFPLHIRNNRSLFVLRNSEEVFLNHKKLQKDVDYQMIYETGEILLNPSLSFDTYDILTVRFQYANQNYRRWSSWQSYRQKSGSSEWEFFHLNETDQKFKPLLFDLDSITVQALQQANGNNPVEILSAVETAYTTDKILYKKIVQGNSFYFEHVSAPENTTLYEVKFSYKGAGNGDYIFQQYLPQGPVFQYAGPGQGDFSPYFSPALPQNNHYTGFSWKFHRNHWVIETHQILNSFNPNTFSTGPNTVHSLASAIKTTYHIAKDSARNEKLYLEWQNIPRTYHLPQPLHLLDFTNNWGIDPSLTAGRQRLIKSGWFRKRSFSQTEIQYNSLTAERLFLHQTILNHTWHRNKWFFQSSNNRTWGKWTGKTKIFETYAQNLKYEINRQWKSSLEMQYKNSYEKHSANDSLSYRFYRLKQKLEFLPGQQKWQAGFQITGIDSIRQDRWKKTSTEKSVFISRSQQSQKGRQKILLEWTQNQGQRKNTFWTLSWQGNWHDQSGFTSQQWQISGNGSMLRKYNVIYTRVPDGQGQFQWIDYNGNGVEEPEEFEPAYYTDQADYIKIYLPTTQYEPAFKSNFKWNGFFNFRHLKNISKIIRNLSVRVALQMENQTPLQTPFIEKFFPGNYTVQGNYRFVPAFEYRIYKYLRFIYSVRLNGQTENLYNGLIKQFSRKHQWQFIWTPGKNWQLRPALEQGYQSYYAQDYPSKNYGMDSESVVFPLIYSTSTFQFHSSAEWNYKKSGLQFLRQNAFRLSFRVEKQKNSLQIKTAYLINHFTGQNFSPAGFIMLEGLSPGKNFLFTAVIQRKFKSNLELNLQYKMRKPENIPVIHTGFINLTARF